MPSNSISAQNIYKKQFISSLIPGLLFSGIMILVKLVEMIGDFSLAGYGLKPRQSYGLFKIISFPFLHADWSHLFSNILPLIFFITLIYNLYPKLFWKVLLFTYGLSGFWTWCFARPGTVIGASGWVYALLGFLLWAGFGRVSRRMMVIAGGLAFLYGGMVYGLVPIRPNISWEGHLMGLIAGFLAAFYWRNELKESPGFADESISQPITPDKDPSYPYWLYPIPHVLDHNRQLVHPDELIWVNGQPQLKPKEEIPDSDGEDKGTMVKDSTVQIPTNTHTSADPFAGLWNVNIG